MLNAPSSLSWTAGFYLGALSMPLYAAGYFGAALLVARNSKAIATLLAASGFVFGFLTGESHVAMGTAATLIMQGEPTQDMAEMLQRFSAITPLVLVLLTQFVATSLPSLIWAVAILQGKSELPRWAVVALPLPVSLVIGFAAFAVPGQASFALAAMSLHLAHIPMFSVAWWKATDLPPPS